jgi:hypothetical protein
MGAESVRDLAYLAGTVSVDADERIRWGLRLATLIVTRQQILVSPRGLRLPGSMNRQKEDWRCSNAGTAEE